MKPRARRCAVIVISVVAICFLSIVRKIEKPKGAKAAQKTAKDLGRSLRCYRRVPHGLAFRFFSSNALLVAVMVKSSDSRGTFSTKGLINQPRPVGMSRVSE